LKQLSVGLEIEFSFVLLSCDIRELFTVNVGPRLSVSLPHSCHVPSWQCVDRWIPAIPFHYQSA